MRSSLKSAALAALAMMGTVAGRGVQFTEPVPSPFDMSRIRSRRIKKPMTDADYAALAAATPIDIPQEPHV